MRTAEEKAITNRRIKNMYFRQFKHLLVIIDTFSNISISSYKKTDGMDFGLGHRSDDPNKTI